MGCANDIARNKTKNCISTLKKLLAALTYMNVAEVLRNSSDEYLPSKMAIMYTVGL